MAAIDRKVPTGRISGQCNERFAAVADQFERNFNDHGEVGASICITLNGETVVDLWGGTANPRTETPWNADTICTVFSSTKGAVALAAHVLISSGALELNAPVAKYWPEFAKNGKESATVRMMLDHSVGVPCLREPLPDLACCDWETMVSKLEDEEALGHSRMGDLEVRFGRVVASQGDHAGADVGAVDGIAMPSQGHGLSARPTGAVEHGPVLGQGVERCPMLVDEGLARQGVVGEEPVVVWRERIVLSFDSVHTSLSHLVHGG